MEDPDDEDAIDVAKAQIKKAKDAYDALTEDQKYLLDPEMIDKLKEKIEDINKLLPDDEKIELPESPDYIDIQGAAVTVPNVLFTGAALRPEPQVSLNGQKLTKGVHFKAKYSNNINAGSNALIKITGIGKYCGEVTKRFTILKRANTLSVKGKTVKLKAKSLKKKKKTLSITKAIKFNNKGQGTRRYRLVSVKKSKFKKYFKINSKTGKITVKKKLKKGTYKVKVKVTAAGTNNYKALTKAVTFKVKVK